MLNGVDFVMAWWDDELSRHIYKFSTEENETAKVFKMDTSWDRMALVYVSAIRYSRFTLHLKTNLPQWKSPESICSMRRYWQYLYGLDFVSNCGWVLQLWTVSLMGAMNPEWSRRHPIASFQGVFQCMEFTIYLNFFYLSLRSLWGGARKQIKAEEGFGSGLMRWVLRLTSLDTPLYPSISVLVLGPP